MSVMLFIIALVASFIIVRIGAVAFELTGLEWSLAKFQSLSCFSGTGFTTKEAELITGDKRRRRIASVLMVLGNAGLVTMIATVANALNPENTLLGWLSESYLSFLPKQSVIWVNLVIIAAALYAMYKIFNNQKLTHKFTQYLRQHILKYEFFQPVSFEELLLLTGGYGITQTEVPAGNALAGKTLAESGLRKHDIIVLAIHRKDDMLPSPEAATIIQQGDWLILFGKLENIRGKISIAF